MWRPRTAKGLRSTLLSLEHKRQSRILWVMRLEMRSETSPCDVLYPAKKLELYPVCSGGAIKQEMGCGELGTLVHSHGSEINKAELGQDL